MQLLLPPARAPLLVAACAPASCCTALSPDGATCSCCERRQLVMPLVFEVCAAVLVMRWLRRGLRLVDRWRSGSGDERAVGAEAWLIDAVCGTLEVER